MCFYYVPIGSKSSYPVQKFLLGAFLLGPKVPIGRVPIGLTDEFIGLKNSSQSARFWFLLGAFLLGSPPVYMVMSGQINHDLRLIYFLASFRAKSET